MSIIDRPDVCLLPGKQTPSASHLWGITLLNLNELMACASRFMLIQLTFLMQMGIESWAGLLSINYQVPLLASVHEALTTLVCRRASRLDEPDDPCCNLLAEFLGTSSRPVTNKPTAALVPLGSTPPHKVGSVSRTSYAFPDTRNVN